MSSDSLPAYSISRQEVISMKVSELTARLQRIFTRYGDVNIYQVTWKA
jgi:hypothetical protein